MPFYFIPWLIAVPLFVLYVLLRIYYPKLKGMVGEYYVKRELSKLDPKHYFLLNDIMLPSSGHTNTTQIDHLVVSNYGIFSIETKNYTGWIFGNAYDDYWTQVIYYYKKKFYNPLKQNYGHVKAIEEVLRRESASVPIFSIIVFPSADKLKISGTDTVVFWNKLLSVIQKKAMVYLSDEQKNLVYEKLKSANISNKENRKRHIFEVKQQNKSNHL